MKEDLRKKARHLGREVLACYPTDLLYSISEFVRTFPSMNWLNDSNTDVRIVSVIKYILFAEEA